MENRFVPEPHAAGQPDPATGADVAVPSPLTDEAALSALLALAGPEGAIRLLAQIETDLTDVRIGMAAALAAANRDGLRRATHVLISLAGTIGAPRLQRDATTLNDAAHNATWHDVERLSPMVVADLVALIADLQRRKGGGTA
jgi:HPt (histidine-containing phosphotransfer) domain-containing protein